MEQQAAQEQAPEQHAAAGQPQQGAAPAGQQQQQGQAAGGADPPAAAQQGDDEGPASKRQRVLPPVDFSYEPKDAVDLVLKTSDGKRLGLHSLIMRRSCGFFKSLLDACGDEMEVAVVEAYADIKPHLLDILYSRAAQIKPEIAMKVFQLADKYEAADLMAACRPVFMSDAFKMRIKDPHSLGEFDGIVVGGSQEWHADWLDVLALSSKHRYDDLFGKASEFLVEEAKKGSLVAVDAAQALMHGKEQLAELHQQDLLILTAKFALCTFAVHKQMHEEAVQAAKQLKSREAQVFKLEKQVEHKHKLYLKLLGRFNRLFNKCEKEGVTWHKDLDAPAGSKKKK